MNLSRKISSRKKNKTWWIFRKKTKSLFHFHRQVFLPQMRPNLMPSLNWLTYYLGMVVNGHAVLPTLANAKFFKKWFAKSFRFFLLLSVTLALNYMISMSLFVSSKTIIQLIYVRKIYVKHKSLTRKMVWAWPWNYFFLILSLIKLT